LLESLTISYGEVVARMFATVVLCGLIALERETRDQAAGFRAHILLGLGAALFTLVSAYGFPEFSRAAIGLASGAGFYFGAAATTAVVLIALYALRGVRVYVVSRFRNVFAVLGVHFKDAGAETSRVVEIVEGRGVRIRSTDTVIEDGQASYELQLRIPPGRHVQEMLGEISALPSVRRVEMTGLQEVE
jgi:putative Mg2+ transporter-C (MgtC) family protein